MNYNLKTPCNNCPFRSDVKPFIRADRVEEIIGGEFACHKTTKHDDQGDHVETDREQHCAGSLILHEREEQPHQMMRICERTGSYDRTKLDMDAAVYESFEEMRQAYELAEEATA